MVQSEFEQAIYGNTTNNDFTVINNGVDKDINIIVHVPSGFFNITKITKSFNDKSQKIDKIDEKTNEVTGIPVTSTKKINDWFRSKNVKNLINACKKETKLPLMYYELKKDTPVEFHGTYIHEILYDHFLSWLDTSYAIKISMIINNYRNEVNKQLKNEIIEKADKIDELKQIIERMEHKQDEADKRQIEANKQQLQILNETKQVVCDTNEKLDYAIDTVDVIHETLTDVAYHSTAIVESNKQTYFALTCVINDNGNVQFRTWRTQRDRIFPELSKDLKKLGHQLVIPPMYVAGPMNIPRVAMEKVKAEIRAVSDVKTNKDLLTLLRKTGIKLVMVNPVWVPNKYVSCNFMVNTYLDVISDCQAKTFKLADNMPKELKNIIAMRKQEYMQRVSNATADAKKYLETMVDTIQYVNDTIYKLNKALNE